MRLRRLPLLLLLLILILLGVAWVPLPGYTRLTLTDADSGRRLFAATLRDGEQVILRWTNSLYRLPVTEVYLARDGMLVQERVTFGDESVAIPVTAIEAADLYHTGGSFTATGLERPFSEILFRIGEIGDPRLTLAGRTIALKEATGFGGRIRLVVRRATPFTILLSLLSGGGYTTKVSEGRPAMKAVCSKPGHAIFSPGYHHFADSSALSPI